MTKKQVIVAVSGAFDPIHAGQVKYLCEAAKLGDRLVVILNSDEFLMRKKGFVFFPFAERKAILENIKGVDEVVAAVDEDQTVRKTLEMLKPDIFAKGGAHLVPRNIPEAETCRNIGCKLVLNVGGGKIHTDEEIARLLEHNAAGHDHSLRIACPYCDNHPMLRVKCIYCGGTGKIEVGRTD